MSSDVTQAPSRMQDALLSKPSRFNEVHADSVPAPLVAAGQFGEGVAQMFLNVAIVDLRRGPGREARAQRTAGEEYQNVGLDQPGDALVRQPGLWRHFPIAGGTLEDRTEVYLGESQPVLQRVSRTALFAGAASDLRFTPDDLTAQMEGQGGTMARLPSSRIASFCTDGRACLRLVPTMSRSSRSSANTRCAAFQASPAIRRSVVPLERAGGPSPCAARSARVRLVTPGTRANGPAPRSPRLLPDARGGAVGAGAI